MQGTSNCRAGGYTLLVDDRIVWTGEFTPLFKKSAILRQRGHKVLLRRSEAEDITTCVINETTRLGESEREWRYKRAMAGAEFVTMTLGVYHYSAKRDDGVEFTVYAEDYEFFAHLAQELNVTLLYRRIPTAPVG